MFLPRSPLLRLALFLALTLLLLLLSTTLEPRKTAYSCRTVWSCFAVGTRHGYHHPIPSDSQILEAEVVLHDGTTRYRRQVLVSADTEGPETLFLVLTKDAASWSSDFRSMERTVHDFIDLLVSTDLDLRKASLGIATASEEHYSLLKAATSRLPVSRLTIFLRADVETGVSYTDRHAPAAQLARRSAIAAMRNYLMISALQDEQHVLWLDADVVELSPGILQTMMKHSEMNGDAGIITAECWQNQMDNYDKNAWKLAANANVNLMGVVGDPDRENAVTELVATRSFIPELIQGTSDEELVPLDSVGGTILYIRADLIKQGVVFPLHNVVGTTWSQAGWVGVETEGICFVARGARGGGCYVLGGRHHVRHTDWG